MGFISVLLAAAAAWVFGAIWYMALAKPWMEAAGLSKDQIDNKNPGPFIVSFLCAVLVAGMTRHILASGGMPGLGGGMMVGLGLGLFVASPWIATNYMFAQRSRTLILIDAGYATGGCTIIGAVLSLF